jgi:hypothetical protein
MVPTFVPKFSYIIPFRYTPDRILGLKRILEYLTGFQGVEVLVIEQDTHSKIDFMDLRARHYLIRSDAPFNKSWAYNVGMKRAVAPIIIFGEADYFMNPLELIECLKLMDTYDCIIPNDKYVQLSPRESSFDTNTILQIRNTQPKKNLLDGLSIFKREAINKIAGWNEDMIGLGYENEFNELKIKKYLNYKQMSYIGFHLYHQPNFAGEVFMNRNKQILDTYKNDVNLLDQHLSQVYHKIGQANRFATMIG